MKILRTFPAVTNGPTAAPCALAIGNFDGVHRGHQALLQELVQTAQAKGLVPAVLTFEPHPRDFFASQKSSSPEAERTPRIQPLRDKLLALAACGVQATFVLRFDPAMASQPAERFVRQVLAGALQVRHLVLGDDFRFGAGRAGDVALLRRLGAELDFAVQTLADVDDGGRRISSTALRTALLAGDMAQAQTLLGQPYALDGRVRHGQKLGRTLGFPTLNQRLALRPPGTPTAARGIFVSRVHQLVPGQPQRVLAGVSSLGTRPTLGEGLEPWLETHVLDWPRELGPEGGYGRHIRVELLAHLHFERRYAGLAELQAGIAADLEDARRWHAEHPV
ncbi:bifunctional riboflavin kinase/FAD synthetase [Amphibiibacter pelophylacis]|uniref:Bifunctional riboflavin kinase/FAD synthetase n=1 Tax=Amphibiibacter pelophylacis TaxID=1799477 RepID=A0ACC6NZX3_9BURK